MKRLLFFALAAMMMLGGAVNSAQAQMPQIFTKQITNPYGVPANVATTVHLEAEHFGRPIVRIPCTYDFYVVDYETKQLVDIQGFNRKEITIPTNGGRLNADIEVNLPARGMYIIKSGKETVKALY
jgi:hypothetical protein